MAGSYAGLRCTPDVATRLRPAYSRCLVLQPHRGDRTSVLGRARFVPRTDHRCPPLVEECRRAETPYARDTLTVRIPCLVTRYGLDGASSWRRPLVTFLPRRSTSLRLVPIGNRTSFKHAHGRAIQSSGRVFSRRARLPRRRCSKRVDELASRRIDCHTHDRCVFPFIACDFKRFRQRSRGQRAHSWQSQPERLVDCRGE